jgi:hypothetical protein
MGDVLHDPVQLVHVVVELDALICLRIDDLIEEPPVLPLGIALSERCRRFWPASL